MSQAAMEIFYECKSVVGCRSKRSGFRAVGRLDFSEGEWIPVHPSPWFRDYSLRERFQDPENDPAFSDFDYAALPDEDDRVVECRSKRSGFRAVGRSDFSEGGWIPVHSSPWFRDYSLRERFQDPGNDPAFSALPDEDDLFDDARLDRENEDEERREYIKELVSALKWKKVPVRVESPRYAEKAPKIVKTRVSPRTIQQPR